MEYHAVRSATHVMDRHRNLLLSKMDPERKERIKAYRFQDDGDRALIGTMLSRTVLCRLLGLKDSELIIVDSPQGKPILRDAPGFGFNISHSGAWIVCGAGPGRVGVDVERVAEADAAFAERYFSLHEARLLRTSESASRNALFSSIWALKESYIKALGGGLAIPLDGFSVHFRPPGIRVVSGGRDAGFHLGLFENLDPDFAFAMCSENPPPEKAREWDLEILIGDFLRFC